MYFCLCFPQGCLILAKHYAFSLPCSADWTECGGRFLCSYHECFVQHQTCLLIFFLLVPLSVFQKFSNDLYSTSHCQHCSSMCRELLRLITSVTYVHLERLHKTSCLFCMREQSEMTNRKTEKNSLPYHSKKPKLFLFAGRRTLLDSIN